MPKQLIIISFGLSFTNHKTMSFRFYTILLISISFCACNKEDIDIVDINELIDFKYDCSDSTFTYDHTDAHTSTTYYYYLNGKYAGSDYKDGYHRLLFDEQGRVIMDKTSSDETLYYYNELGKLIREVSNRYETINTYEGDQLMETIFYLDGEFSKKHIYNHELEHLITRFELRANQDTTKVLISCYNPSIPIKEPNQEVYSIEYYNTEKLLDSITDHDKRFSFEPDSDHIIMRHILKHDEHRNLLSKDSYEINHNEIISRDKETYTYYSPTKLLSYKEESWSLNYDEHNDAPLSLTKYRLGFNREYLYNENGFCYRINCFRAEYLQKYYTYEQQEDDRIKLASYNELAELNNYTISTQNCQTNQEASSNQSPAILKNIENGKSHIMKQSKGIHRAPIGAPFQ